MPVEVNTRVSQFPRDCKSSSRSRFREIDEAQRLEAESKAGEALIVELLRQGNISAERACGLCQCQAVTLGVDCPIVRSLTASVATYTREQACLKV
jgi:hypothetical protein